MNTIKILMISLGLMICVASCSDGDQAAEYKLVNASQIEVTDGTELNINVSISDLDGLQQIVIVNEELGIDLFENITSRVSFVTKNISVTIVPEEIEEGTVFDLDITSLDLNGNSSSGTVSVDIY